MPRRCRTRSALRPAPPPSPAPGAARTCRGETSCAEARASALADFDAAPLRGRALLLLELDPQHTVSQPRIGRTLVHLRRQADCALEAAIGALHQVIARAQVLTLRP